MFGMVLNTPWYLILCNVASDEAQQGDLLFQNLVFSVIEGSNVAEKNGNGNKTLMIGIIGMNYQDKVCGYNLSTLMIYRSLQKSTEQIYY